MDDWLISFLFFKVIPRVEKTEVFRKSWNFAHRSYFASCIMRNYYFLLWTKETAFFPYFHHGIIFCSAEIFICADNFKFYLNIYIFKSNIKGAIFELRSRHLFRDQPYKEVLEVKCQACNFTGVLSFTNVFEDFGHIFPTCFSRNRKILKSDKTFYGWANIGDLYN